MRAEGSIYTMLCCIVTHVGTASPTLNCSTEKAFVSLCEAITCHNQLL